MQIALWGSETLRFWCRHRSLASLPNDPVSLPAAPRHHCHLRQSAYPVLLLIPDRLGRYHWLAYIGYNAQAALCIGAIFLAQPGPPS